MRSTASLPAIAGLATIIALGAIVTGPTPVSATDPSPTPAPTAEPVASPAPTVEPTPVPSPSTEPVEAVVAPPPTSTTTTLSRKERIRQKYIRAMKIALRQRHDRYVSGGTGPNAFDCSGLVRFAYKRAEISHRLGGGHSARAMLQWAREHGKTRKHNPKKGDVVIWGNGSHAGIWIGNGKVISALNPQEDIKLTRLHALGAPFTAFIRTRP